MRASALARIEQRQRWQSGPGCEGRVRGPWCSLPCTLYRATYPAPALEPAGCSLWQGWQQLMAERWQQPATIPTLSSSSSSSSLPPTQVLFCQQTPSGDQATLTHRMPVACRWSRVSSFTLSTSISCCFTSISCCFTKPAMLLPPQGMLHCFTVCWSMQQQHHAPANNRTCSTTLGPAGWQEVSWEPSRQ